MGANGTGPGHFPFGSSTRRKNENHLAGKHGASHKAVLRGDVISSSCGKTYMHSTGAGHGPDDAPYTHIPRAVGGSRFPSC